MTLSLLLPFLEPFQRCCSASSFNINPGLSHCWTIQCGLDFQEIESCLTLPILWIRPLPLSRPLRGITVCGSLWGWELSCLGPKIQPEDSEAWLGFCEFFGNAATSVNQKSRNEFTTQTAGRAQTCALNSRLGNEKACSKNSNEQFMETTNY